MDDQIRPETHLPDDDNVIKADVARLVEQTAMLFPQLYKDDNADTTGATLKIAARARQLGPLGLQAVKAFAKQLRSHRAFEDLWILTSELRTLGMADDDLLRLEIQSLIELGVYATAEERARMLLRRAADDKGRNEAWSAIGRIHKQAVVNAFVRPKSEAGDGLPQSRRRWPLAATAPDRPLLDLHLDRAHNAYATPWRSARGVDTCYHAINAVALARLAEIEQFHIPGADPTGMAQEILATIPENADDTWNLATRAEALLSLGRYGEAATAYARFAQSSGAGLFEIAAALRQLEEVWRLSGEDPVEGAPVRILKASLLSRTGASEDSRTSRSSIEEGQTAEMTLSRREAALLEQDFNPETRRMMDADPKGLEQVFSVNAPLAIGVIRHGLARARAICRIDGMMGGEMRAFGTGFVVEGRVLHEPWGRTPVIVTNSHVISSAPSTSSLPAGACRAVFTNPDDDSEVTVRFAGVVFESRHDFHDVTILAIEGDLPASVVPISERAAGPLPSRATDDTGIGRVYVIGHPAGGSLSFSFADNILLDHDAHPVLATTESGELTRHASTPTPKPIRLHYRAPTLGGSSGSPVFDFNSFSLLGVHHRGLPAMPRLAGKEPRGPYAANEGIWIESIRAAISDAAAAAESAELDASGSRGWKLFAEIALQLLKIAIDATSQPGGQAGGQAEQPQPAPVEPSQPVVTPPPFSPPTAPIFGQPLKGADSSGSIVVPTPARVRVWPGAMGSAASGASPVAAELLKAGRISASEAAAMGNESVIGADDRTRIFDTALSPWRMICALRCWWGGRLAVGTGFLVSPDLILTAGHVTFPKNMGVLPDRIEIYPGLQSANQPYGAAQAVKVSVHEEWSGKFDQSRDVSAIHLAEPIGHALGWFGLAVRTSDQLRGVWSHVTGYPGEKSESRFDPASGAPQAPLRAAQMWHHSSPVMDVRDGRVFYGADTTGGQSGSPIYILDRDASPTPVAIGVHAYGQASTPTALGNANSGPVLDAALFDLVERWRTVGS